jgi:hypothetical protein
MWYAASEILIFLLIALILGGVGGFLLAQTSTLQIGRSKNRRPNSDRTSKQLSAARAEITHLQRLVAETDAKSGAIGTRLSQRVAEATDPNEDEVPDAEAV